MNKRILRFFSFILLIAIASITSCKKIDPVSPPTAQPSTEPIKANAGFDQTITLPADSVTLDGSASAGAIYNYQWTQISGPASSSIQNAAGVKTIVKNLVQGIYLFKLKVTDVIGVSSTDELQIIVNANPLPQKTIKVKVLEYGTDIPIAGAVLSLCTSPVLVNSGTCSASPANITTNNNGEAFFNADKYRFNAVSKAGYWSGKENFFYNTYFGDDSSLYAYQVIHTADSFIVRLVAETSITLHIKNPIPASKDLFLFVWALNSENSFQPHCTLRPGIDTTFRYTARGNLENLFIISDIEHDNGSPDDIRYYQPIYIPNTNSFILNITY